MKRLFNTFDLLIFTATFIAFLLSNYLWFTGNEIEGVYVGIWVLSIIAGGIYFKLLRIVKFILKKNKKWVDLN